MATDNSTMSMGEGWPFAPNEYKTGWYRQNHTSNVSMVYHERTIPVPWPWLLFSMSLSFIVAAWSHYSIMKLRSRESTEGQAIRAKITLGMLFLTTIRSVPTFILAIRAYTGTEDRFPPVSAIGALLLAAMACGLDCGCLPSRYYPKLVKRIAQFDALLLTAATVMMMIMPFIRGMFLYGFFWVAGGQCPVVVEWCSFQPQKVGCPSGQPSYVDRAKFWDAIYRDIAGLRFRGSFLYASELALAVVSLLTGVYILIRGFGFWSWAKKSYNYVVHYSEEKERRKRENVETSGDELYFVGSLKREIKKPVRKDASVFAVICCFILLGVSVPLHAVQQVSPPESLNHYVMDGFGPEDNVRKGDGAPKFRGEKQKHYPGENNDASSWVDCYTIHAPSDKYGFINKWIKIQRENALTFIAMI